MDIPALIAFFAQGLEAVSAFELDVNDFTVLDDEILVIDDDGVEFRIKITKYPHEEKK